MKHIHAIKLLRRSLKVYEREAERLICLFNIEDLQKIQSHISELKISIKFLEDGTV